MLNALIENNYAAVVGCLFLLVFILTNHLQSAKYTKLFLGAICCILALVAVDSLELWAASWARPSWLRVLMSVLGYILRPMAAYLIICILKDGMGLLKRIMLGLLIVNTLCAFSAFFSPIMFSYSADNAFVRGPLGFVPFLVSAVFLVFMLVFTAQKYHDGEYAESMIALCIVLMSVVSIVAESVFHFKGPLNATSAIAVIFYYLYFQTQQLKRDQLTDLRDRRCFYLDAEKRQDRSLALLSLDINDLKTVNDTSGHAAGDQLICRVVDCILRNLPPDATAYRMGGDEFAILSRYRDSDEVEEMVRRIRLDVEAGGSSCAIGTAIYPAGGDLERAMKEADMAMYEDKRRIKSQRAEARGM